MSNCAGILLMFSLGLIMLQTGVNALPAMEVDGNNRAHNAVDGLEEAMMNSLLDDVVILSPEHFNQRRASFYGTPLSPDFAMEQHQAPRGATIFMVMAPQGSHEAWEREREDTDQ